jgi:hypothetical protein
MTIRKYKQTGTNSWLIEVQENGKTKELFLEFPPDAINQVGWAEGDDLEWIDNEDGSFTIQKKREGIDSTNND